MLFNSIQFILFFPFITLIYYWCSHKYRWAVLLAGSYYFYMCWKPEYLVLILLSTTVDYFAALAMEKAQEIKKKKRFLFLSLFTNLGLLGLFKYWNFVSENLNQIIDENTFSTLDILLPVGISFYTFQTLSYTIDVYRGDIKAERHFGKFALFVSFFPQLVAGPIERAKRFIPQLYKKINYDQVMIGLGLKLMTWGFFKKLVIADNCGLLVNQVYNNPETHKGIFVVLAALLFPFQIYADFSGYSDIAIGAAMVLGITLMQNFNRPFIAQSIGEHWKRWHISLSTWFMDYLYIPLGGSKTTKWRWYYNLFITFLISGLWHGANWTFILWGAYHGALVVLERMIGYGKNRSGGILGLAKNVVVFLLIVFGFIIFRSNNLSDVPIILNNLVTDLNLDAITEFFEKSTILRNKRILVVFFAIVLMMTLEYLYDKKNVIGFLNRQHFVIRFLFYIISILAILMFGNFTSIDFIYFQF